jgi:hypothetical protein
MQDSGTTRVPHGRSTDCRGLREDDPCLVLPSLDNCQISGMNVESVIKSTEFQLLAVSD